MNQKTSLIVTMGGQPQKVTYLLDLLLARGEPIEQVLILYLASYARSKNALHRLEAEFLGGQYGGRPCLLRLAPLRSREGDLEDIRTAEEVEIARQNINRLLADLKAEHQCIHLGLSGGRRLISLTALAAAMQYLTPVDHLWHTNIPAEKFKQLEGDTAPLHVPPEAGVRLLPVPFVPWVSYFPGLADLLNRSPQEIGETAPGWMDADERDRCSKVWKMLTRRQRDVLQVFANGLGRQEVAMQLHISVSTVDSHRESILEACRLVWEAQAGEEFSAKFLQLRFGPFLAGLQ
jgi:CRISPR-associated protein Csx14